MSPTQLTSETVSRASASADVTGATVEAFDGEDYELRRQRILKRLEQSLERLDRTILPEGPFDAAGAMVQRLEAVQALLAALRLAEHSYHADRERAAFEVEALRQELANERDRHRHDIRSALMRQIFGMIMLAVGLIAYLYGQFVDPNFAAEAMLPIILIGATLFAPDAAGRISRMLIAAGSAMSEKRSESAERKTSE